MKKKPSILDYLKYRFKSVNEHGVHSPFVFDLVTNVIYADRDYYAYKPLERLRVQLLETDKLVENRKISDWAAEALAPKYAQLLFRLINRFQPDNVFEIGTSIGIETAYMAKANSSATVLKIEPSQNNALAVKENFKALQLNNIDVIAGFRDVLQQLNTLDFVFINIQTLDDASVVLSQCFAKADENSVFVINDISVSKEMKAIWEEIKSNDAVKVTLDLFQLGIVFFRKEQAKEHFVIRF